MLCKYIVLLVALAITTVYSIPGNTALKPIRYVDMEPLPIQTPDKKALSNTRPLNHLRKLNIQQLQIRQKNNAKASLIIKNELLSLKHTDHVNDLQTNAELRREAEDIEEVVAMKQKSERAINAGR